MSQEDANQLVDLANAELREKKPYIAVPAWFVRQRRSRWSLGAAGLVLVALQAVNFGAPLMESLFEARPPVAVARREVQALLDTLVDDIESFRKDYHELPESLVEIGVPPRGRWTYEIRGRDEYTLQGSLYGQQVTFDSSSKGGAR